MYETYPRYLLALVVFALVVAAIDVPAISILFLVGTAVYFVGRRVATLPDRRSTS